MYKVWKKWMVFTTCIFLFAGCNPKSAGVVIQQADEKNTTEKQQHIRETEGNNTSIGVYVCGQVKNPGVYELEPGARIADAIDYAGGVTKKASLENVNLAAYVEDGEKIKIPSRAEEKKQAEQAAASGQSQLNINLASASDFMTLPGIGESRANDIVAYRQENGEFQDVSEIMNVAGIKEGIYNRIKDKITT
jgi:competence protein ComEA